MHQGQIHCAVLLLFSPFLSFSKHSPRSERDCVRSHSSLGPANLSFSPVLLAPQSPDCFLLTLLLSCIVPWAPFLTNTTAIKLLSQPSCGPLSTQEIQVETFHELLMHWEDRAASIPSCGSLGMSFVKHVAIGFLFFPQSES